MPIEEDALPFAGQLSREDLRRTLQVGSRLPLWARIALIPIGLVLVGSCLSAKITSGAPVSSWLPGLIVVVAIAAIVWSAIRKGAKANFDTNRLAQEGIEGSVLPEAVRIRSAYGQSELPWNIFYKATAASDYVLLYVSHIQCHVFPRRYFASDEAWTEFKRRVTANVLPPPKQSRLRALGRTLLWWLVIFVTVIILWYFSGR